MLRENWVVKNKLKVIKKHFPLQILSTNGHFDPPTKYPIKQKLFKNPTREGSNPGHLAQQSDTLATDLIRQQFFKTLLPLRISLFRLFFVIPFEMLLTKLWDSLFLVKF